MFLWAGTAPQRLAHAGEPGGGGSTPPVHRRSAARRSPNRSQCDIPPGSVRLNALLPPIKSTALDRSRHTPRDGYLAGTSLGAEALWPIHPCPPITPPRRKPAFRSRGSSDSTSPPASSAACSALA